MTKVRVFRAKSALLQREPKQENRGDVRVRGSYSIFLYSAYSQFGSLMLADSLASLLASGFPKRADRHGPTSVLNRFGISSYSPAAA